MMTCRVFFLALSLSAAPFGFAAAQTEVAFQDSSEAATGSAQLTPAKGGVLIGLTLEGMPPSSWLGFHIHQNPACDHAAGHEAAGGHFNPGNVEHGWLSETGPHAGDLPNIRSDAEGRVEVQVFAPLVTWEPGEATIQGRALIVHAKADDYKSQPSGDAGERLACAVIPAP